MSSKRFTSNLKDDFNELTKIWSDCNLNNNVCLLLPFVYKSLTGLKANQHHRNRSTWKNIPLFKFLLLLCLLVWSLFQNLTASKNIRAGLSSMEAFSYAQLLTKEYKYIFLYYCMPFFSPPFHTNMWTNFTNNLVLKDFRVTSNRNNVLHASHLPSSLFCLHFKNRHNS